MIDAIEPIGHKQPEQPAEQPTPLSYAEIHGFIGKAGIAPTTERARAIQVADNEPIVLPGDPTRRPTPYPGGIQGDWMQAKALIDSASPYGRYVTGLFEKTYTPRSNENRMPANLTLNEVPDSIRSQVDPTKWLLLSDSDLYLKRSEFGGRDLKIFADFNPGSQKNPGHLYAFGRNSDGMPVGIFEYSRDQQGGIHYLRQFQVSYGSGTIENAKGEPQRAYKINISEWVADGNTAESGPKRNINGLGHTNVGNTTFYETLSNKFAKVERYDGWNPDQPRVSLDFVRNEAKLVSGRSQKLETKRLVNEDDANMMINSLAKNFYLFNLFGPPPGR